ncbi:MAG TPA: M12 family metallo-peptidase [Anaerolineaceae bacterium]|jgi:hypothetical protein|nr:M12 family metallo-peptidase [Anaerolineaceae bacterium]
MKNLTKKISSSILICIVFLLILSSIQVAEVNAQSPTETPVLFGDLSGTELAINQVNRPSVVRSRFVSMNLGVLMDASKMDPSKSSDQRIEFNLFDDAIFTGKIQGKEESGAGVTWTGALEEVEGGYFFITLVEDIAIVHVASTEGVYEVSNVAENVYKVIEIDQTQFVDCPPGELPSYWEEVATTDFGPNADTGAILDIMVAYTPQALAAEGSVAAINARIALAVAETNTAYANVGVTPRLRLVYAYKTNYNDTGNISTDLSRLISTNDGYMDEVHGLRNTYAADMVTLWVEDGGSYCGLASSIMANAANAFQVTALSCATGYYSFGHEFGHLQGLRHDMYVDPSLTPYSHGHGYTNPPKRWRTVMAYNNACTDLGVSCTRLQYFSNPTKYYNGSVLGDSYSENYRVLNSTAYTVANFRVQSQTLTTISPKGNIKVLTPTYRWYVFPGATKYQLQLLKESNIFVYSKEVSTSACSSTICTYKSPSALPLGTYTFRVRPFVNGAWAKYSDWKEFTNGMFSDFSTQSYNWSSVTGVWGLSANSYSSTGVPDKWASAVYKSNYSNFTLTTRFLRTPIRNSGYANIVYFRGNPTTLDSMSAWKNSYAIGLAQNGAFWIGKYVNGTFTFLTGDWIWTDRIVDGWNNIKVIAEGGFIDLYINGYYMGWVYDTTFTWGKIGVGFYRSSTVTGDRMYFDFVKVTPSGLVLGDLPQREGHDLNATSPSNQSPERSN